MDLVPRHKLRHSARFAKRDNYKQRLSPLMQEYAADFGLLALVQMLDCEAGYCISAAKAGRLQRSRGSI